MNSVLQGALIWRDGGWIEGNLFLHEGRVTEISSRRPGPQDHIIDLSGLHVLPGFTDVHVHLREPGFSMKETMATGTLAAARGGYCRLCAMPNLRPAPDSLEHLKEQLRLIEAGALVQVLPYGTITVEEKGERLSQMAAMAPYVAGFSDDGRGVQDDEMMRQAMMEAKRLNHIIVAHCEAERLVNGGVIHDGDYARQHGLPGNDPKSEWGQLKRDLDLLRQVGGRYHACHISSKESVALIRQAKAEGLDVTCETAPHYLLMDDSMLQDDGRFKMNPPIRAKADREALLAGLIDGTVDMIATDHAPHTAQEKAQGLLHSMNGIVGLETAFPLLYHHLVLPGILSTARLVEAMHFAPNRRFQLPLGIREGEAADLCVWDLRLSYAVDPEQFVSMGRATPFTGWQATGRCRMTIAQGRVAWREGI